MRNMSFSLTTEAVRRREKTVTRRGRCKCHVRLVLDKYTGVLYCPRCHTPRALSKKAETAIRELGLT